MIISRYFGSRDAEGISRFVHANFLFAILSSAASTAVGTLMVPYLLRWMNTPENVLPQSLTYLRIYFAGVATVIFYNTGMSILRALGDSLHPLYYLLFSSVLNIILDLLFVAVFHWGVAGAAFATVFSQGLSALLCVIQMAHMTGAAKLDIKKLWFDRRMMREVVGQGFPTGIQNSVMSIGNVVVQSNINAFGEYAMSGCGAYSKLEGFIFLPILSISMALPTFIRQNLGARKYERARRGARIGIISGALFFLFCALTHCTAGVLRGCGKSYIPMIVLLLDWCAFRILYVTVMVRIRPVFSSVSSVYPVTWIISSAVLLIYLTRSDWTHAFEKKRNGGRTV